MGSFFTNVQLFVHGRDEAEMTRLLLKELGAIAEDAGLAPTEPGEEPDRSILIEHGGGILSVFDEATEGQDGETISELASRLARALSAQAMTVTVHDSDVLYLSLWDEKGNALDAYNSRPDFFGKVSAAEKKRVAGDPAKWSAFLREGATPADLSTVWKEKRLFCEETLGKTLDLLGIDRERATVGYDYAQATGRTYERLSFRARVRPAHEMKATGATRFSTMSYAEKTELSRGFPAHITFSAKNEGGASGGMSVVVAGDAIERGLVDITQCQLVIGLPQDGNVVEAPFVQAGSGEGATATASFANVAIPAGSAADLAFGAGIDPRTLVTAMYSANVHANMHGTGGRVGSGTLTIAFIPSSNAGGAVVHKMTIETTEAPRRPLRAPAHSDARVLRPLQLTGTLFLLVMLDRTQKEALPFVRRALASFAPHASTSGNYRLEIFKSEPGERPSSGTAKAQGFFESARFEKLCQQMAAEARVSATCGDNHRDFMARERTFGDGFSFGTSLIRSNNKSDPELPTFGVWLDVTKRSDAEIESARATLHEIADDAMRNEHAVQAIVTRWGWAPSQGLVDTTAYELAIDVQGPCTLRRSWATRFLRGVGAGTLWLGKSLASRIADMPSLAACAEVDTGLADVVKITIKGDGDLDRVERALSNMLPTQEDYRRALHAEYGR